MPRLIRIAVTLFLSATVLLLIVRQRAMRLAQLEQQGVSSSDLRAYVDNEAQMVIAGLCIAGVLLLGGVVLTVMSLIQSRKRDG